MVKLNLLLSEKPLKNNSAEILYKGINLKGVNKETILSLFMEIESFSTIKIYQEKVTEILSENDN